MMMKSDHKDKAVIHFWGVRGTFPVPGASTVRYGGNTNCISIRFGTSLFFVFDAGTGIRELSNYVMKELPRPFKASIFITHPHWDHINGIPHFEPFYVPGNEFDIYGYQHDSSMTIDQLISAQMDNVFFPVTIKEMKSKITFHNLQEGTYDIDGIKLSTMQLVHPGGSLGYRIDYRGHCFCYISDNELYLKDSPNYKEGSDEHLIEFIKGADIVIMDTTYTDEQYPRKVGWFSYRWFSCIK